MIHPALMPKMKMAKDYMMRPDFKDSPLYQTVKKEGYVLENSDDYMFNFPDRRLNVYQRKNN